MNLEELLELYDMKTAQELNDYISYLINVQEDYEILKDKVRNLSRFIDDLY